MIRGLIKNIKGAAGAMSVGIAIATLASCAGETTEPLPQPAEPEGEKVEVEVRLTLSGGWDTDEDETRGMPPSTTDWGSLAGELTGEEETASIDKVQLVTFRRKAADPTCMTEEDSGEKFYLDPSNTKVIDIEAGWATDGTAHDDERPGHRVAKGKLTKVYGYEYRVVALAYDSKAPSTFATAESLTLPLKSIVGDDNRMDLHLDSGDALSYEDFCADFYTEYLRNGLTGNNWGRFYNVLDPVSDNKVLSHYATQLPQLFHGECVTVTSSGNQKDIIRFAELDEDGNLNKEFGLAGILKRGFAKVELQIIPTYHTYLSRPYGVTFISLMANNVYTTVKLGKYEDFLKPYNAINHNAEVEKQNYTVVSYHTVQTTYASNATNKEPVKLVSYMLPCKTKLAVRIRSVLNGDLYDAKLLPADMDGTGENGTGIISPDSHDGWFYLRRNHKYIIRVSDSDAFMTDKNYQF